MVEVDGEEEEFGGYRCGWRGRLWRVMVVIGGGWGHVAGGGSIGWAYVVIGVVSRCSAVHISRFEFGYPVHQSLSDN